MLPLCHAINHYSVIIVIVHDSPDDTLSPRSDGLEVLVPLEDGEPGVPHLDGVEVGLLVVGHLVTRSRGQQRHDQLRRLV